MNTRRRINNISELTEPQQEYLTYLYGKTENINASADELRHAFEQLDGYQQSEGFVFLAITRDDMKLMCS